MLKMYDLKELNRRLVDDGSDLNTMNERAKGLIQGEEKSSHRSPPILMEHAHPLLWFVPTKERVLRSCAMETVAPPLPLIFAGDT